MKDRRAVILGAVVCAAVAAHGVLLPQIFWKAPRGSARTAREMKDIAYTNGFYGLLDVELPSGEWQGVTVCGWFRVMTTNETRVARQYFCTTGAFWCADPIDRDEPDLFGGELGYGGEGVVLTGAVVAATQLAPNVNAATSNGWPNGVCTIAGSSEYAVTLVVGGEEVLVGPGEFNRNVIAGPGLDVVAGGTGTVALGVCQMRIHQFYSAVDGVADEENMLTATSTVSNEYAFCVWRFSLTGEAHEYRGDLWQYDLTDQVGQTVTEGLPASGARALSSVGMYRVGLLGLGSPDESLRMDVFDARVFPYWLSDDELLVIHGDGVAEIERRGIPRWRGR